MTEEKKQQKKSVPFIEILKGAARIIWQNRFLLWFGFLMALGSPGSFNIGGNEKDFGDQEEKFRNFAESHWQAVITLAIIIFAIGIILFLISLVAKAGLVKSVNLISQNKKTSFREGWKSGKKYFGKLFGLSLLFFLVIFVLVVVLAIPVVYLVFAKSWAGAILVGLFAIAIFIPLIFIFSLTKIFAELYIILSDLNILNAVETGYNLLLKNTGNSIIFALLLLAVALAAAIILLPVAGIVLFILVPTGIVLYYLSKVAFIMFLGFAIIFFLTAILFISSIFQSFRMTAWVLFFREIAKVEKPKTEKIAEEELKKSIAITPEKA